MGKILRRLQAMDSGELSYLSRRKLSLIILRLKCSLGIAASFDAVAKPEDFEFCSGASPMLPELPWDAGAISDLPVGAAPLGADYWHKAPDTGASWPTGFFSSIHFAPGNAVGDVQLLWIRGRLQELVTCGLICAGTADDAARRHALNELEGILQSWRDENPWLLGIHYISSLECALRLLSVCHAADLARPWISDRKFWCNVIWVICSHAYLIEKRICLFSAAGNHTIGECVGLIYAAVLLPEHPDSNRWFETGMGTLEQEVGRQITFDGGNREQSFQYLLMVVDLCGLSIRLLESKNKPVPAALTHAYKAGMHFLNTFAKDAGSLPAIGDSDDGFALSRYLRLSWESDSANQPPDGARTGLTTFPNTGVSLIDFDGITKALFVHGALGTARGFGHGHADSLSVILSCDDKPVLVDSGTYLYAGDELSRRYFRGTSAHNTVAIDGLDQAVQQEHSDFGWSSTYVGKLVRVLESGDGNVALLACHDGYSRIGAIHWRALIYRPDGTWVIWDRIVGSGEHELQMHWHIDAAAKLVAESNEVDIGDGKFQMVVHGGELQLYSADSNLPLGWISRRYGVKESVVSLRATAHCKLPHELVTIFGVKGASGSLQEPDQTLLDELRTLSQSANSMNGGEA